MAKIVTETYITDERGFHYKVGDDIAFQHHGAAYIGVIISIGDTSFKCKNCLKNQVAVEDMEFNAVDVTDLTFTSYD